MPDFARPARRRLDLQGRRAILGFETRDNFQVTEWDPPHAFASTAAGRPFRSLVSRVPLESRAGGTHLVLFSDFELQPTMKLLWPFIGAFYQT